MEFTFLILLNYLKTNKTVSSPYLKCEFKHIIKELAQSAVRFKISLKSKKFG